MTRGSVSAVAVAILALAGARAQAQTTPAQTSAKSTTKTASGVTVTPRSGREGTTVTIKYPSAVKDYPQPEQVLIEDPGVHGYYFAHGAGIYITYDGTRDSKYTVQATAVPDSTGKNAYRFTIPEGVCGVILQSTQATVTKVPAGAVQGSPTVVGQNVTKYPTARSSSGKRLQVSIVGEKGKPTTFSLTCDKYTVSVNVKADPTEVSPLPGTSTVTATVAAKGAVQAVVGQKVKTPPSTPTAIIPIGRITVMFTTDFGAMAPPTPAKVVTSPAGTASVAVSSPDPGKATVIAVAQGLGDGRAMVEFSSPEKKPEQPRPGSGQIALGGTSATDQCAAETQKRHHDIVAGLQGHPTHEIAQAIADSDAKNPSVAQCARRKGGGGSDDTVPAATGGTGDPALDGVNEDIDASLQKILDNATYASNPPNPNPHPSLNGKKYLLSAAAASAAVAAIFAAKGGGGGGATTTGGGTTGGSTGGGGSTPPPTFTVTSLNSPPSYKGDANLQQSFAPPSNALCQGSDAKYGETVTVNLNASGSGTITLDDTPNFQRVYNITGLTALNQTVNASGTFSFLGVAIPGTLSVTFNSTTSLTMRETTSYGSCSNTYAGTMTR